MSKKKNSGYTGYLRQRKNGSWEGRYLCDGVLKSVYGKTGDEVREKINKIYSEILAGAFIGGGTDTVGFWLNMCGHTFDDRKKKIMEMFDG
ncbi:MAG: hypothetical protein FWE32_01110 [Oscillospiraceae bacterium]|nr:hypothetical protein [Oscillospiraceae bacterium]